MSRLEYEAEPIGVIGTSLSFSTQLDALCNDVKAREAVPALAEKIADMCLRAGVSQADRLLLAQLAMEVVTERLDQSGCFDGAYDD
jgi:hypothetical protein